MTLDRRSALVAVGTAITMSGCLGNGGTGEDTLEADATVEVRNHVFDPDIVMIEPGETVGWTLVEGNHSLLTYHEDNGHPTRVPDDTAVINHNFLEDDSLTYTFETEGVYDYFCEIRHAQGMIASVVVGEPDEDDPGLAPPQDGISPMIAADVESLNERVREEFGLAAPAE